MVLTPPWETMLEGQALASRTSLPPWSLPGRGTPGIFITPLARRILSGDPQKHPPALHGPDLRHKEPHTAISAIALGAEASDRERPDHAHAGQILTLHRRRHWALLLDEHDVAGRLARRPLHRYGTPDAVALLECLVA